MYGHGAGERWRCWCTNCLASIDPGWAQDRHTVRDMWNRRPIELNALLTLEELREMGGEPVWVQSDIFPQDCGYRVIQRAEMLFVDFTDGSRLSLTDYDKSWFAYRRKPEEVARDG